MSSYFINNFELSLSKVLDKELPSLEIINANMSSLNFVYWNYSRAESLEYLL